MPENKKIFNNVVLKEKQSTCSKYSTNFNIIKSGLHKYAGSDRVSMHNAKSLNDGSTNKLYNNCRPVEFLLEVLTNMKSKVCTKKQLLTDN